MDFQAAASSGDTNAVRTLLKDGIVVTKNWHMTRPPLCLAAGNGHTGVVKLLIEKGKFDPGDVDAHDRTALSWAAGRGHKKAVKYLIARDDANLDASDEEGWTALSWASANGFATVAKLLIEKKANVNSRDRCGRTPLSWASSNGHKDVVKTLLAAHEEQDVERDVDKKKRSPFLRAAAKGNREHVEIMKRILAKDRTCLDLADEDKRTPLSWAAGAGRMKATQLLLREKVKIGTIDKYGRTPLSWAAEAGHEKVVEILLAEDRTSQGLHSAPNAGANIGTDAKFIANIKDRGNQAPILYAAKHGHDQVVKLLIDSGTSFTDAPDNEGRTPLSWAAGEGHDIVVDVLLGVEGVDINKRDKKGETALSWAAKGGHRRVVWTLSKRHRTIEPNHARMLDKRTALSLAAVRGLHAIVKELLFIEDIDKDVKDNIGKTALMLAYEGGHEKTMKFLIEGQASLEIRFPGNMTILMLAAQAGKNTLVQLLMDHGADVFAVNAEDKSHDTDPGLTAMRYAIKEKHRSVAYQLGKTRQNKKPATQNTGSVAPSQGALQTSAPTSIAPRASRPQIPTDSEAIVPSQPPQAMVAQPKVSRTTSIQTSIMQTPTAETAASSSQNTPTTYNQPSTTQQYGNLGQTLLAAAAQAPIVEVQRIHVQTA